MGHIEEWIVVGNFFYGRTGSDGMQRNAYFLDYSSLLLGEMSDGYVIRFRTKPIQQQGTLVGKTTVDGSGAGDRY